MMMARGDSNDVQPWTNADDDDYDGSEDEGAHDDGAAAVRCCHAADDGNDADSDDAAVQYWEGADVDSDLDMSYDGSNDDLFGGENDLEDVEIEGDSVG